VRAFNLLAAFARRGEVSVVSFGTTAEHLPEELEVASRTVSPSTGGRLRGNLARPAPLLPGQVRLFLDAAMTRAVREEEARFRPDVVHLMLARMGPYLGPDGGPHRHLDLTDSLSLNMRTRADRGSAGQRPAFRAEAELMRRYEARLTALADSASVVSEADREVAGLERAAVVPNGVDLEDFPFEAPIERPARILFFGNLGYFHNAEPAEFLARRVLPLLRGGGADVRLRVAGARPARLVRQLAEIDGFELAADVPNMAAELHGAAVAVLPSFSGSGIKNKVLESFCAGLPVVANELGMRGVEGAEPGTHYLRAESAEEIAGSVASLLESPSERLRLATAGRELIAARYTWDAQADRLEAIYDGLPAATAPTLSQPTQGA
jgi:glycosyltransferase involved in cell wall biosynthesis